MVGGKEKVRHMKKLLLLLPLLLVALSIHAQKLITIKDKAFNYGAKVGVNATFPIINSLTIDGVEAEDISLHYKVGYQASFFCRVNINRFFIQPDLTWSHKKGDILFSLPEATNTTYTPESDKIQMETSSLELPIMIGYYVVKEGPYALSLMVGPKMKYNYKSHYTTYFSDVSDKYINNDTPFGLGISTGVGVNIWRLFFEFTYEFGLNTVESDFKERTPSTTECNISIDKRTNMMNFSLGVLF